MSRGINQGDLYSGLSAPADVPEPGSNAQAVEEQEAGKAKLATADKRVLEILQGEKERVLRITDLPTEFDLAEVEARRRYVGLIEVLMGAINEAKKA